LISQEVGRGDQWERGRREKGEERVESEEGERRGERG
jgi:hypothetical protein